MPEAAVDGWRSEVFHPGHGHVPATMPGMSAVTMGRCTIGGAGGEGLRALDNESRSASVVQCAEASFRAFRYSRRRKSCPPRHVFGKFLLPVPRCRSAAPRNTPVNVPFEDASERQIRARRPSRAHAATHSCVPCSDPQAKAAQRNRESGAIIRPSSAKRSNSRRGRGLVRPRFGRSASSSARRAATGGAICSTVRGSIVPSCASVKALCAERFAFF